MTARLALLLSLFLTLAGWLTSPAVALAGPNDGLPKPEAPLDRATPRRTLDGFQQATRAGELHRAAHFLDLRGVNRSGQPKEGPELARKLAYVLERKLPIDPSKLSDAPDGGLAGGANSVVAGVIFLDDEPVNVSLTRVRFDDGVSRWLVSRSTVTLIPSLYATFGPRGWEEKLPPFLTRMRFFGNAAWQWGGLIVAIALGFLGGRFASWVLVGLGLRLARQTLAPWDDEIMEAGRRPSRLIFGVMVLRAILDQLHLTSAVQSVADHVGYTFLVVGVAWFVIRVMAVGARYLQSRLPSEVTDDDIRTRGARTQLAVMGRISTVGIAVLATAVVLLQFEVVRNVGVSLLASAGIAGIVVGLAAQKSLAGVIAGIQISITQPVRIGDTVVIEGEQGTVEEINLTYVVVRVWDQRRLVVPIARFLDTPFQNWTKVGSEIMGTVMIPVDFNAPVERIRQELRRLCEAHPGWDGRACALHVIDASNKFVMLRALVSSTDASKNFELRCWVREHLVEYLRDLDGGAYVARDRGENVTILRRAPSG